MREKIVTVVGVFVSRSFGSLVTSYVDRLRVAGRVGPTDIRSDAPLRARSVSAVNGGGGFAAFLSVSALRAGRILCSAGVGFDETKLRLAAVVRASPMQLSRGRLIRSSSLKPLAPDAALDYELLTERWWRRGVVALQAARIHCFGGRWFRRRRRNRSRHVSYSMMELSSERGGEENPPPPPFAFSARTPTVFRIDFSPWWLLCRFRYRAGRIRVLGFDGLRRASRFFTSENRSAVLRRTGSSRAGSSRAVPCGR